MLPGEYAQSPAVSAPRSWTSQTQVSHSLQASHAPHPACGSANIQIGGDFNTTEPFSGLDKNRGQYQCGHKIMASPPELGSVTIKSK